MPANKKTGENTAIGQQQHGQFDANRWMIDELSSLGLDGVAGAKLVTTLLEQHPRKADRVTQVRKYLTTAGFKRAGANSISRTIVAVVEGSLPPTSLKDKVDTSSERDPHQRHQQLPAGSSDDLEFWSPSGEEFTPPHQPADTPSPPRVATSSSAAARSKKVKPVKITGRDLTTMLGVTQERSIQQYSDDEGHGGRVLTRHTRKPLTTASKGRGVGRNLRPPTAGVEFPRATMAAGSAPRPAGVWADPTRSGDRSRSLSPELSELYGTAGRKGGVKLTGMQLLQVFDNVRAQRKLKQDMAGRKLRNKTDDGESSGDEMVAPPAPGAAAASVSSADVFEWHSPSEGALASPSAPEGGRQVQRDKPRRVRGNKAHERPQDFEKLDTQLEQERQATEDLFASLPSVPINDDEDINTGGVYHALSRKEKKKNAKNAAAPASKSQSNSKPQLPVVAASDTMMLQLLAKHQAAQREEAEKKKKIEEDERKRVEEEEAELRRQQEEEKARLEREEQWRRRREEAQKRQDESKRREEEEARQRQVEAARKAEEDRRRQAVEEAVRKEKEEMLRKREEEEKEREGALRKEREEELRKLKEAQEAARQSQLEAERLRKENEEREAQAVKEAESGKEQEVERREAALAAMQAVMDAREKEFQEKMKVMQERLQQLEANKVENGESSARHVQQQQQQQIIDRQLSVISASRSNSAKQQCITSMKHFLQRLSRQYDIHVDTGSWKKRLEAEGEGAAPTWNWCDQLLVFRPLDSRGSKVLPTPMSSAMDTDNCEVRITHVMLCTNYVGLIVGDVQVDGEESRERLAAGVIVCGRSGGLPGQSPVGTYRAIDVVRAALRRNKDVLDSDWTMQGVKELRDLDVTPQSSLTNVDHKHEDVYVQELSKPMIIAAPRETITVKQRAPQPRSGSTSGLVVPPWRRGTSATDEQQQLPWASGAAAGLHRQQSGREMLTMSNALLRTGEKREYTDFQTCLDKEGRSYGILEMLRVRQGAASEEPPKELKTLRVVKSEAVGEKKKRDGEAEGNNVGGRFSMGTEGTTESVSSPSRPRAAEPAREAPWRSVAVPPSKEAAGFW